MPITGYFLVAYELLLFFALFQEFENKIKQWCKEAGEDVSYEFLSVGHCNHYNLKQLIFGENELVLESGLLRACSGPGNF